MLPHLTDQATLNRVLGVVIGEMLGYLFTATWTVTIVRAPRIAQWLGWPAAVMIATGVLGPFDVPGGTSSTSPPISSSLGSEDRAQTVDLVS